MKVRSPGNASRMPATSRISIDSSPSKCPFSSAASSFKVRVTMPGPSSPGALSGACIELANHFRAQVEAAIGVHDRSSSRVEHDVETLIPSQLLHHAANLLDDLSGGPLVLLRRAPGRPPDLLDESLVLLDGLLERFLFLLPLHARKDRALVPHLGAKLVDDLLLLGGLRPPVLHLAVELLLGLLGETVLLEDLGGVDEADAGIRGPGRNRHDQAYRRQGPPRHLSSDFEHPVDRPSGFCRGFLEGRLSE